MFPLIKQAFNVPSILQAGACAEALNCDKIKMVKETKYGSAFLNAQTMELLDFIINRF